MKILRYGFLAALAVMIMSTMAFGQATIMSNNCASATAGWTFTNGAIAGAALPIQQSGYWLLDNSGDSIITTTIDVHNYSNLVLTFNVATYGSGTNHPCLVEYSSDDGATWNATTFTSSTPTSATYIAGGPWNIGTVNTTTFKLRWTAPAANVGKYVRLQAISLTGTSLVANDGDGSATLTNVIGSGVLNNTTIFSANAASQSVKIAITGTGPTILASVSVTIPYQWTWTGTNVAPSTDDGASLSGQVITGDGSSGNPFVVTYTSAITNTAIGRITISNLTSPNPTAITDNGNYLFEVKTAKASGTLTALTAGSPKAYVIIPLANIRNQTGTAPVLLSNYVATQGVATVASGVFSTTQMQSYLQDGSYGVNIFSYGAPPTVTEGNSYIIKGQIQQYLGNTEVVPSSYSDLIDNGVSTMPTYTVVTAAALLASPETYEGRYIAVQYLNKSTGTWPTTAANATLIMSADAGVSSLNLYIISSTSIWTNPEPAWPKDIKGIFYQINASPTYSLAPRYYSDIAANGSLPVELTTFTAMARGKKVELKWSTATEVNNSGFDVEKMVGDTWIKIGFVSGNGTSNVKNDYSYNDNVAVSGSYSYRLKQIDRDGKYEYSNTVEATIADIKTFDLSQNYPNPFNPATVINYQLPVGGQVALKVYNMLGKEVATLVNETKEAGAHSIKFDGSKLSSGIYFYTLRAGSFTATKKLTLMK